MEFGWTEEQQEFRADLRRFLEEQRTPALMEELANIDPESGARGPEAKKFRDALNDAGYTTMAWPKEYGGQAKGGFFSFILSEELGYSGLPYDSLSVNSVGATIMGFGSEEQKREWLPKIQTGEMNFAIGYTEPNAGTDLASLQTRAIRDGDDYVINGQKIYTSGAHVATHVWLAARTDPDAPKHRGVSMFVVPLTTPGITVRPLYMMSGGRTNETFWEDVRIPAEAMVGEENRGWYMTQNALDLERVVISPAAPITRTFEKIVTYVKEKRPDLIDDSTTRAALAQTRMDVEIARALATTNAMIIAGGMTPNAEASMGKTWTTEAQTRINSLAMDLFGGYGGLTKDSGDLAVVDGEFENRWFSSPASRFGGGTNDIQRRIIATRGLGLPRG